MQAAAREGNVGRGEVTEVFYKCRGRGPVPPRPAVPGPSAA